MYGVEHYLNPDDGRNLYEDGLLKLRDRVAQVAVLQRILRVEVGNFGYRVDYAIAGKQMVLLLCGGDKHTQDADIVRANS